MNFFQLCHLLESQAPHRPLLGEGDTPEFDVVRFRPFPLPGFPGSEVIKVELERERPHAPPSILTSFLGLYGVNARMPHYFTDDIVLRREGSEAVAAFLDMFNHRIATLFYRSWRKYRYPLGFRPGGEDSMSGYLLCLAGFGIGNAHRKQGIPSARLLALLGLLMQRTRTAEGLVGVIRQMLPGALVVVAEFQPVWIRLSIQQGLGSRPKDGLAPQGLGDGHVLGRGLWDRTQTVRLSIQPADAVQVNALLPGASLHADMMNLMRVYLGYKVDVELKLRLPVRLAPVLALRGGRTEAEAKGEDAAARPRLGWTSLLKPVAERVVTISLGGYRGLPV
ncbi:type VI secretion system baseplate subunit TssG [Herbaspirillum lusitanum]|uniref:Type VI secretion system baseplate subunit TssG n=1 Tax=Herbaspirillum lusitanum TaxID=213312 RepID=A0ABW9AFB0_9BURK